MMHVMKYHIILKFYEISQASFIHIKRTFNGWVDWFNLSSKKLIFDKVIDITMLTFACVNSLILNEKDSINP